MLPGVYLSYKKDNTAYYRSSLTYKSKHISLGSFNTENEANMAYQDGFYLLHENIPLEKAIHYSKVLTFSKVISLVNYRDNNYYISNPIYLHNGYFSYYLSENEEYKFDIDDLFYYTSHRILKRNGHLFINDYGMQITLASRYGIHTHAVLNRDYEFINGDIYDYRYSNIHVINPYYGVFEKKEYFGQLYEVKLNLNGTHLVGVYHDLDVAAIAYNKAIDIATQYGINKNYKQNYIETLSSEEYAEIYTNITLSKSFLIFLEKMKYKFLDNLQ